MSDKVLDRMKEIEAKKEKAKTVKVLNMLKEIARRRQEDKDRSDTLLDSICDSDKEKKQIIDWINNLDDVQVSEDRKQELAEEIASDLAEEKRRIERKLDEKPEQYFYPANLTSGTASAGYAPLANGTGYTTTATLNNQAVNLVNTDNGITLC